MKTPNITTRRHVLRSGAVLAAGLGIGLGATGSAAAEQPNFSAGF